MLHLRRNPCVNTLLTITFWHFYMRGTRLRARETGGLSMHPIARSSRLNVCLATVMRNSSYIHCERSISRQRTTPWIAGIARRRRDRITEIASGRSLLQAELVWRVIRPALNSERRPFDLHG